MKAKYPNGIGVPYAVKASGRKAFSNGIDKVVLEAAYLNKCQG